MFPMELAAGPMSLLAGVDRPALSIGLHICPTHGNITKGTFPFTPPPFDRALVLPLMCHWFKIQTNFAIPPYP